MSIILQIQKTIDYKRLTKFGLVGFSGTIITLTTELILTEIFKIWYPISLAIGWMLGFLNNFFWNRKWTFQIKTGNIYKQGGTYLACTLIALGINEIITVSLTELGRQWYFWSSIIGTGFSTIVNYVLVKNLALNPNKYGKETN